MIVWALTAVSLLATWLNIRKVALCFPLWTLTNASWAAVDWHHGLPQQAALHVVYLGLAVYGTVRWRQDEARARGSPLPEG